MNGPRAFAGSNLLLALMIRGGYMPEVENMSFSAWLAKLQAKVSDEIEAITKTPAVSPLAAVRQHGKSIAAKAWSKMKGWLVGKQG